LESAATTMTSVEGEKVQADSLRFEVFATA
jgi:hypothetical protein